MISISERGKITDLQGNILTASQQSVLNWTPAGDGTVDLSFENNVNHIAFSNYGDSGAKARFIEEYGQIYNVVMPNAWADYFLNIWKSKGESNWPNNPYLYTYSEGGDYKNFLQVDSNSRLNSSNVLQIYKGDRVDSVYNTQFSQDRVSTYYNSSSATFTISNGGGNINHYWGDYDEWLGAVTKNYTLLFDVTMPSSTPAVTAQQFVDAFASYGITCSLETANDIVSKVSERSSYEGRYNVPWTIAFMVGTALSSTGTVINIMPYYTGLQNVRFMPNPNVSSYTIAVYGSNNASLGYQYRYNFDTTTNTIGTFQNSVYGGNAVQVVNDLKGFLAVYTSTKYYLLTLSARSTTGFTKDTSIHDIIFTNGNKTYTLEVNLTASQEYRQYSVLFTPTSANCSLKLDLSGMQGSGIEIDIKDIGVYEIGGGAE